MVFEHDYKQYPELTNAQIDDFGFSSPHMQITEDFFGVVEKVVDGDTVRVVTEFRDFDFPVRLLDIDAPEMNEGGTSAKEWLRAKVEGEEVFFVIDGNNRVGKYGRLLAQMFHTGMNVAQEMYYLGMVSQFGSKRDGDIRDIDFYLGASF